MKENTESILDRFAGQLHTWTLTGIEPSAAANDLRCSLDRQEKRLKAAGISREENYEHVKEEISGSRVRNSSGYESRMVWREASQNLVYRKGDKVLRRIRRPVTLYANVLNREGYEDTVCTCPNCGHTMMTSQAREGCPYCRTFFETDDVYPCVKSYYTVPGIVERANLIPQLKKEVIIAASVCALTGFLLYWFTNSDMETVFRILMSLFMAAFTGGAGAFVWYMIRSFLLLGRVFREAGRAMPMMKALNSRKKMETFMQEYEPDFSFEHFEGRVLSLLQTIAFADDRGNLSVYTGSDDLSCFDTLADMQYRGALQLKKYEVRDGSFHVLVRAFLTDTYASRGVREKD